MSYIKPKTWQDQKEEYTKTKEVLNLFNRFCEDQKMPVLNIIKRGVKHE